MSSIILRLRVILYLIFTFVRDIITSGGKNMDFLQKLDYLMKKNNLNKSSLSKACDIPYTTIDGWYKKGYEGLKLPTVRKLADYFNTSLDYWADDTILEPFPPRTDILSKVDSSEENAKSKKNIEEAVKILDSLTPELQEYAIQQLKGLLEVQAKTHLSK